MKKKIVCFSLCLGMICCLFKACYTEDRVENYFTFTGELIGGYIENRPEYFSEYRRILDTTGVMGLLKAYGLYTCFVPTDEAFYAYYEEQGRKGMSDFSLAELKTLCYDHILKGDTIATNDPDRSFDGTLGTLSMSGRFVNVSHSDSSSMIYVYNTVPIVEPDIALHNGIIHVVSRVMEPSGDRVSSVLAQDEKFRLFAEAFEKTGYKAIMDEAPVQDVTYDPKNYTLRDFTHTVKEELPEFRKFGYTILAESDETLAAYKECPLCPDGVRSFDDLCCLAEWFYSDKYQGLYNDGDAPEVRGNFLDKRNYLNRYIAYHCIDKTLLTSRFVKDFYTPHHRKFDYPMFEYIPTMLENTLLEVKLDRTYLAGQAQFGLLNCRMDAAGKEELAETGIQFTDHSNQPEGGALNGVYHEITAPLAYTDEFLKALSSKRLRIEGAACLRETATNNMRGNNPEAVAGVVGTTHAYQIPFGYFENMTCTEGTKFTYIGACAAYEDFQGDEIYCRDQYNFTIKTIPIPAGNYEVRMGYQATDYRGIAQLYWDSIPAGIPVNFSLKANDPSIGHEVPGSKVDDPYGYENDKMMRNRGYMKGPDSYWAPDKRYSYNAQNCRYSTLCLRYIMGTFTFEEAKPHYLTVVFLGSESGDSQFMLDYIEFCPTELILTEDTH